MASVLMTDRKEDFTKYIHITNADGSGKASSYIRAIDLLCDMLKANPLGFDDCKNIWAVDPIERLHELYVLVLAEARKNDASVWNIKGIPKSYLQNGFCSAALVMYQKYLFESNCERELLSTFDEYEGDELGLVEKLAVDINVPEFLIDGLDEMQGNDIVRAVRVRTNQNVFRKMILTIYNQSCCITGLNIPEIIRASHIIPWAVDEGKRLDPTNGLCLSATYDAAFDKNLISLDDDYRLILSKDIKYYCDTRSVKEYFINKEGMHITLPAKYKPNKEYLAAHRNSGSF